MTEKDLDIAIEKCERILECDTRTLKNPESENGWLFDKVYELLQFLRQFQFEGGEDDTISRAAAITEFSNCELTPDGGIDVNYAIDFLKQMPPVDAVPVVRCKDCKHRPTGTNRNDLEFPDYKCPCQCEDFWYSWKPSDDWFCRNGEQS